MSLEYPIGQENGRNKSALQARILFSVKSVNPEIVDSDEPGILSVTFSVRQTFSCQPSRPLTISTTRTPIYPPDKGLQLDNSLKSYVRIQYRCSEYCVSHSSNKEKISPNKIGNDELKRKGMKIESMSIATTGKEQKIKATGKKKGPLTKGTLLSPGQIIHFVYPDERKDLRESLNFITIPSFDSSEEFLMTKSIDLAQIVQKMNRITREVNAASNREGGEAVSEERKSRNQERSLDAPEPGDLYDIYLTGECHIAWWNWGDVRGHQMPVTNLIDDISNKKLVLLPHPLGREAVSEEYRRMLREEHSDWLPAFGCWDLDWEDEEGNEMVYLDVDVDNGVCTIDSNTGTGCNRNISKPRDGHLGFNAEVKQGRSRFQLRFV